MSRRLTTQELVRKIGINAVILFLSVFYLLENLSAHNKFWSTIFSILSALSLYGNIRDCHYWKDPK